MPKEVIRKSKTVQEGSKWITSPTGRTVEVSWMKDGGTVQIVTADYKAKLDDGAFPSNPFSGSTTPGWFVDLTRAEINKLIRSLRTARDQAYGRDE